MLVQRSRVVVPGRAEYSAQVGMRHPDFALSIIAASGLVIDWGVQSELVSYIARQRRVQLSIVLDGHGYYMADERACLLGPGDVVELDQSRHKLEGYAGSPCLIVVLEWENGGYFGPARRDEPRHSRIDVRDVARMRAWIDRVHLEPPERWIADLRDQLRAIGLSTGRAPLAPMPPTPASKLYAALGPIRERLHAQPSLPELAAELSISERQARRDFGELEREHGMTIEGWRDFISDARLSWAQQLLSIHDLPLARVAELAGFGSQIALTHAFTQRGGTTPGQIARRLRERWR